jgi:hypothetical protein
MLDLLSYKYVSRRKLASISNQKLFGETYKDHINNLDITQINVIEPYEDLKWNEHITRPSGLANVVSTSHDRLDWPML